MSPEGKSTSVARLSRLMPAVHSSESLSAEPITLLLAALVGILAGYGAVLFNVLIHWTKAVTLDPPLQGTSTIVTYGWSSA